MTGRHLGAERGRAGGRGYGAVQAGTGATQHSMLGRWWARLEG